MQYDSAEINVDGSHEINVDDLIQMDLDKVMNDPEVLETPNGADVRESTPSKSKPKLNSTLPKPIAPELPRSDDIAPDLPHIRSPLTVSSPTSDHELDIESILRNTSAPAAEDPLLDFDPNGLSMVRCMMILALLRDAVQSSNWLSPVCLYHTASITLRKT